ncbi:putative bifunctional diguanylate cyclase/phosphodiesterase [Rheinheimera sp.]|uniref:putative bifunctional diguanylate cyclase/phosphodiesterase n=1 Tax=Rheinheimera sp. TaxID=1869214 RepID=UPI003D2CCD79
MAKTILLVDDEPAILRALQRTLQRAGYRVLLAEHGVQALSLLSTEQVALVISDFRMPDMNGAELLQQVRLQFPSTIGLILSAYADREALLACLNSGAAWRFMEKPWEDNQLLKDITAALNERDRRQAEQQRTNLLLSSNEALLELSATGQVLRFNNAASQVLGLQPSELRGQVLSALFVDINPIELAGFFHKKDHDIQLHGIHGDYFSFSHRISDLHHYLLKVTLVQPLSDQVFCGVNELLNADDVRSQIEDLLSSGQNDFAVVALMLPDFALYSDSLPQQQLDELIEQTGLALKTRMPPKALLGYVAADKFLLVLRGAAQESQLQLLIEQCLQPFRQPLLLSFNRVQLAFCVGYAVSPSDGTTARQLLQHADVACRHNLANPAGFYLRFESEMVTQKRQHFEISNSLYAALEGQEFTLCYQPKIRLSDGFCDSAEALIRWHHPTYGAISPAVFIPIAEQDGQIQAIGDWVMQHALRQLHSWRAQGLSLSNLAINLSGRQLTDDRLAERIASCLSSLGLQPDTLELEVTETFLMADIDASSRLLSSLHQLGCQLAMDDFGTGYSSLAYLAKLPVNKLKLDRSLLLDLEDSPQCASMIRHMIRMAHELGMQVVAEGIESVNQVLLLREMQCDYIQGYVFSKPLNALEFGRFLTAQPVRQQWEEYLDV